MNIEIKQKPAESGDLILFSIKISFESDDLVNFYEFLKKVIYEIFIEIHLERSTLIINLEIF